MWRKLIGIDPPGQVTWQGFWFRSGWPGAALAVVLLLIVAYAVFLYRREDALGPRSRWLLAVCRVCGLAILAWVLFRPVVQVDIDLSVPQKVLVLIDNSQSMQLRDTRKDTDQIAEAAMALGKVPFDDPEAGRRYLGAQDAMTQSLDAFEHERSESLGRARHDFAASLKGLVACFPQSSAEIAARLQTIMDRQDALFTDAPTTAASDVNTAATVQRELLGELDGWFHLARNSGLAIPDKVRTEVSGVSRMDLVKSLFPLGQPGPLAALCTQEIVRYFRFDDHLDPLESEGRLSAESLAALDASAPATALGTALDDAVNRYGGDAIAGVVLFTDGASNTGLAPLEVARRLHERNIRLYPVGVGLTRPDDVSIRSLVTPDVAFANDLVPLHVQIMSSGYEKRETVVTAALDGAEVARKTIVLTGQPQFEDLTFKASRSGGTRKLEVTIAPLPGESTVENNSLQRMIRVIDDKIKVLCIEGSPRWEFRYLRAVLKRDPRIDVQFITTEGDPDLARASKEHIARFPEKEEQAFQYDLVILGDVRSSAFTPTQLQLIERLVREQGGSLIVLGGHKHTPAEYVDTPLAAMLPVWIEQDKWEDVGDDVYPVLTAEGAQSSVMSLEKQEGRTRALWANVKPLEHVAPLLGAKPGAVVLAELSDAAQRAQAYPLIAWQRYGAGKVMYVGTDCLWRLRMRVGDKYHLRFWGQAVQFLTLSRLLGEDKRIRFDVDPGVHQVGQPVQVYANIQNDAYEPSKAAGYMAYVSPPGQESAAQPIALKPVPSVPGLYQGLFTPAAAGRYAVRAPEEDQAIANTAEFDIAAGTTELAETAMQQEMLEKMAEMTGGRFLTLRDVPLLPEMIRQRGATTRIHKEIELWDNPVPLLLLVGFVAFEWAWRRKKNLA
jgi:uncharacterized membrane protein